MTKTFSLSGKRQAKYFNRMLFLHFPNVCTFLDLFSCALRLKTYLSLASTFAQVLSGPVISCVTRSTNESQSYKHLNNYIECWFHCVFEAAVCDIFKLKTNMFDR